MSMFIRTPFSFISVSNLSPKLLTAPHPEYLSNLFTSLKHNLVFQSSTQIALNYCCVSWMCSLLTQAKNCCSLFLQTFSLLCMVWQLIHLQFASWIFLIGKVKLLSAVVLNLSQVSLKTIVKRGYLHYHS